MKRDKRLCDAAGMDADNFYAIIDKARNAPVETSRVFPAEATAAAEGFPFMSWYAT